MAEQRSKQDSDKFIVRMPDGMRDRIAALAKRNGRTSTAEIVLALESWLDLAEHAQQSMDEMRKDLPEPKQVLGTIYVAMDSKGPACWREVMEMVNAINEAGGFDVVDQRVSMVTPEHVANDKRKAEIAALTERLRALSAKGWAED